MSESQGFRPATRRAVRLKLAIQGPSGSGKTLGALALARGLAERDGKIAVIDTENGSASLYADRYRFDALELSPPYLTKKYLDALELAIEGGYKVLVIDSISHQWDGDGGILQRKDEMDAKPGSNHWTNWGPFTKEHNRFRAALLSSPIHIIATMRSKMAYTQSERDGKKKIEKLGLQPLQRDGMEYEFTVTWDVGMDHQAAGSKDRTGMFGESVDLADAKTAKRLLEWLASAPAPAVIAEDQRRRMWALATGRGMDEATLRDLVKTVAKVESTKEIPLEAYNAVIDAIEDWKKPEPAAAGAQA